MEPSIFSYLPDELIINILLYDPHFIWRENRLVTIHSFSKKDKRYILLSKIPRKYRMSMYSWNVILGNNKRKVIGYRNIIGNEWEYFYSDFSYDSFMYCYYPQTFLCMPLL